MTRPPEERETITVAYLSPLVLRKELENMFENDGVACLQSVDIVQQKGIIFWNLVRNCHVYSTAKHSTAQHSTAQDNSTAQHSTAQHDMTQQSTALHSNTTAQHNTTRYTARLMAFHISCFLLTGLVFQAAGTFIILAQPSSEHLP